MYLEEIVDNSITDKNTTHSYLSLYQTLLEKQRCEVLNVLEVGISTGGSIKLWSDFFTNAHVHGVDIIDINKVWEGIKNNNRITLHTSTDAYDEKFVNEKFVSNNIKFDFVLDDGPHTLDSMIKFIKLYFPLLTEKGILIIEDVQDWSWIEILKNTVPDDFKKFIKTYDLRPNKNRYDDIVFTIDKYNV